MPKSITLATAVDKNRVSSDNVYLLLLEVDIIDAKTGNTQSAQMSGGVPKALPEDVRRGNLTEGLYIGLDYEKVYFV